MTHRNLSLPKPPTELRPKRRRTIPDHILQQILAKIGCHETDNTIMDWMQSEHGQRISKDAIIYYRKSQNYSKIIDRYREIYEQGIVECELASKRRRVEELSQLYYWAKQDNRTVEARNILETIRMEREGNRREYGDIFQFNQYNNVTDDDLRNQLEINVKIMEEIKKRKQITELPKETANAVNG